MPHTARTSADQRRAPRATLALMRAVKLVCQAGEYIGLLRDVSASGVRLRLFHPLPAETHILLELASGATYPLVQIWQDASMAGFRFARMVDPAEFLVPAEADGQELAIRLDVPASITAPGITTPARLITLAQGSARIVGATPLARASRVMLAVEGIDPRAAYVRRYREGACELVFERHARLDELADQALVLQPLAPAPASAQQASALSAHPHPAPRADTATSTSPLRSVA